MAGSEAEGYRHPFRGRYLAKHAGRASENGTTIYTVGVGAADGQTIPVRDRFGRQDVLRDEKGEVVKTRLDAEMLEKIAVSTGGLYVPLGQGAEGLDAIYQECLALVPKSELVQKLEKVPPLDPSSRSPEVMTCSTSVAGMFGLPPMNEKFKVSPIS